MSIQEEYPFILRQYRKIFISQIDYDFIITVLREPANMSLGTAKDRYWIKNSFQLQEQQYDYIPQSFVKEFCGACKTCATHRFFPNSLAAKLIIASSFLSRMQVDLVGLTFQPVGEYKYICHVRDHFTRFSWARSLTSKSASEVAVFLYDIFIVFGAPTILQLDNGKEFTADLIAELLSLWPGVHIINGRSRHPESQGMVKRANGILQTKLGKWMEDNKTNNWTEGLPLIIHAMNTQTVHATGKSPYSLVFGQDPIKNFSILEDLYQQNVINEEELPADFFEKSDDNNQFVLDQFDFLTSESSALNQESLALNQPKSSALNQPESSVHPILDRSGSLSNQEFSAPILNQEFSTSHKPESDKS
ncbi:11722_t:CDS:2, partial [Racocetra persica]